MDIKNPRYFLVCLVFLAENFVANIRQNSEMPKVYAPFYSKYFSTTALNSSTDRTTTYLAPTASKAFW